MPSSVIRILIEQPRSAESVAKRILLNKSGKRMNLTRLANELTAMASGGFKGSVSVSVDDATGNNAAGTIAMVKADATAGDTVTVAGQAFTAVARPAIKGNAEYSITGADDAAVAESLQAALQNHHKTRGIVAVTRSGATLTLTARTPGLYGNGIALAKSVTTGSAATLSGAALSGGTVATGNSRSAYVGRGAT